MMKNWSSILTRFYIYRQKYNPLILNTNNYAIILNIFTKPSEKVGIKPIHLR